MKSFLYHLQINIDSSNLMFYKRLLSFLGWQTIFETNDVIGYKSEKNGDLWLVPAKENNQTNYDNKGVNHISLRVENKKDVDNIVDFLKNHSIPSLFGTPKHRPEFSENKTQTYYQVMFASPDNILFEIVYIGPK